MVKSKSHSQVPGDLPATIVPARSEAEVILNNSASKQPSLRKNHFFTYNNYKLEEIDPIVSTLKRFAYKGKIQTEVGKCGTPHLQGMIWCKDKHRDTEFKLPKAIHWETLKDEHNKRDYCGKDETHDGIYRVMWGFPTPLKLITPDRPWQKKVLDIVNGPVNERKVYWFYENTGGVGKSSLCKYLCAKNNAIYIDEGKKADLINIIFNADMDRSNTICIDIPRTNGSNVSYKAIEQIKNGMICNTKYETGMKLFNSPNVLIFSNFEPDRSGLSADRWCVFEIKDNDLSSADDTTRAW